MPPNIRGPLSISVTLTPIRGSGLTRIITLKAGDPCLIGRASKSTQKALEARHDNALFDCPVISREHAELRAHLWDLVENQVTIVDKGSMHGTRVNGVKLSEGQAKTLRSGDIIQFGEKVTRGESTHDGVFVTFSHRQNFTQDSNTPPVCTPATSRSGVYRYPYSSDDDSDYDDDHISNASEKEEGAAVSSAKTTPEQAKVKLGSDELPIDIEQADKPGKTVVPDSLDAQASMLVPESIPVLQRKAYCVDEDSDEDEIAEAIGPANYHVSADRLRRAHSYMSLEQDDDEYDDVDYPSHYETGEVEDISESDASELDHYGEAEDSEEEGAVDEFARSSLSPEPAKEPSPELRSSGQSRPSDPFASSSSYSQPAPSMIPMQVPQAFANPSAFATYQPVPLHSQPPFSQPHHSLTKFGGDSNFSVTFPNTTGASRWDKPPSFYQDRPLPPLSNFFGTSREVYNMPSDPFSPSNPWNDAPVEASTSSCALNGDDYHYFPQSPKLASPSAPAPGRISIPDIVENEEMADGYIPFPSPPIFKPMAKSPEMPSNEARPTMESVLPFSKSTALSESAGNTSKKRKAEDEAPVSDAAADVVEQKLRLTVAGNVQPAPATVAPSIELPDTLNLAESAPEPSAPARKKAKTSAEPVSSTFASAAGVAVNVAKYAAVAGAGGVGMFAFLCSPASETLLSWLS